MAALYEQHQLVLAKIEGTYGVDAAPVAANAMMGTIKVNPLEGNVAKRNNQTGWLGNQGSIRTGSYVTVELAIELAGSGTKDLPPAYAVLYKACGVAEVVTATTKVDYSLIDSNYQSVSLYYYADKALHKVLGARGSVKFGLSAGGIPTLTFSLIGLYVTPSHSATPPTGDFSAFQIPHGVHADTVPVCTFFGQAVNMTELEVDPGMKAVYRNVVNDESVVISSREGSVNITFEEPLVSSVNFFDLAQRSQYGALAYQLGVDVTDAGNIFELAVPQIQITNVSRSYSEGIAHLQLQGDIVPSTRNADLSFTHR